MSTVCAVIADYIRPSAEADGELRQGIFSAGKHIIHKRVVHPNRIFRGR